MPSVYSHDITLEDRSSGSPKLGFMLARRNGLRPYTIQDYRTIPPRILTEGELTQAETPAEVEQNWFQENWQAGMGLVNHRIGNGQYGIAKGYKIDTTKPSGIIQVARELIATTVDINPATGEYKPSGFAIVGTEVWAFIGRRPYIWDYTNKNWDVIGGTWATTSWLGRNGVEYAGKTYIPLWESSTDAPQTYYYKADADAGWTQSTLATAAFKYLAKADGKLWGGYEGANNNQVKSSTDPTNTGSWSAATTIGDTSAAITALVTYHDGTNELLLVCKADGVWTLNAAGTLTHLYDMKSQQHPDHFRGAGAWDANARVILPLGTGGMFELYQDVVRDISFKKTMPDQTWLHGVIVAVAADPTAVFVLVKETTTKYHLVMGELVSIAGVTDYRWHHVGTVTTSNAITAFQCALMAEGVPSGTIVHHRILAGIVTGADTLYCYFYPLLDDVEDAYTNDTDVEVVTVADDRSHPQVNKRYAEVAFTTAQLGANDYWEVKYRVDGGSWTWLTGTQGTSKLTTSPQTLTFGAEVTGKKLELQFLPTVTTTTQSPQILDFRVKSQFRPTPVKVIPCDVLLADGQVLLNGGRQYTSAGDLSQLKTWNAQVAELIYRDPSDTAYNVVFLPGTFKVLEAWKVPGHRAAYRVQFVLAEV